MGRKKRRPQLAVNNVTEKPSGNTEAGSVLQEPLGGFIFVCNNDSMSEWLRRHVFGLHARYLAYVKEIKPGLPIFLFNSSTRRLHGVFESSSGGGLNIELNVCGENKDSRQSGRQFVTLPSAQIRVRCREERLPLEFEKFRPVLRYHANKSKFRLRLSQSEVLVGSKEGQEVEELLKLFCVPPTRNILEDLQDDTGGEWQIVKTRRKPSRSSHAPPLNGSVSSVPSPAAGPSSGGKNCSGSVVTGWMKGKLLGRGCNGNVYFCSKGGSFCAMKEVVFVDENSNAVKQLGQEIALLSTLKHPNIVRYFGTEKLKDRICIYLEYVPGGSIHTVLEKSGKFSEILIRVCIRQILAGLAYLHSTGTAHRDIKGANILVDMEQGIVKLADFGTGKKINSYPQTLCIGSPHWMAPEIIRSKEVNPYGLGVDIWSLGITMVEMATTKVPWGDLDPGAALYRIGKCKTPPPIPDTLSAEGKDFVKQCLQINPAERPTVQVLLEHPYVRDLPREKGFDRQILSVLGNSQK